MSTGMSKLNTLSFVRERLYSPSKVALMSYAPKVNLFMPSKADEEPHLYNSLIKTRHRKKSLHNLNLFHIPHFFSLNATILSLVICVRRVRRPLGRI